MIYKASPIGPEEVPDLNLMATEPFPDLSIEESLEAHEEAGHEIHVILKASLPGGTLDQLLVVMLKAAASRLRVRS